MGVLAAGRVVRGARRVGDRVDAGLDGAARPPPRAGTGVGRTRYWRSVDRTAVLAARAAVAGGRSLPARRAALLPSGQHASTVDRSPVHLERVWPVPRIRAAADRMDGGHAPNLARMDRHAVAVPRS